MLKIVSVSWCEGHGTPWQGWGEDVIPLLAAFIARIYIPCQQVFVLTDHLPGILNRYMRVLPNTQVFLPPEVTIPMLEEAASVLADS